MNRRSDAGCARCESQLADQAARLSAAFEALAAARRGGATVVRIEDMHAVLGGLRLSTTGGQR
ncbi:hypothetical protein ACU61A_15880 [Pseudonocardia sichuanensis]